MQCIYSVILPRGWVSPATVWDCPGNQRLSTSYSPIWTGLHPLSCRTVPHTLSMFGTDQKTFWGESRMRKRILWCIFVAHYLLAPTSSLSALPLPFPLISLPSLSPSSPSPPFPPHLPPPLSPSPPPFPPPPALLPLPLQASGED